MVALDQLAVTCEDQTIVPDALPSDPTHANVMGNKTEGIRKRWARKAIIVIDAANP